MQFKSFAYLLSAVAVVLAQSAQDVLSNLATLRTQLTTLDGAINGFPDTGGSLTQALPSIPTHSMYNRPPMIPPPLPVPPFSEGEGQSVIDAVNGLVPIIEDALVGIVAKKPAFDALPLGGISNLVRQDLSGLSSSTSSLEDALIALAPADLVDESIALKNEVDAAFATAIAAYN
ncbi:hypothetical protein AGABI2DRAFT_194662 [Agaricus bisporus var. bisporus H97]|uniref:hypothetical protein n=1 Tax=Agaricus bisporus var. bisporus (strain H97 / ATCC MYA-4626 / FGSC 10389) TaxID=936046 RepID=UPI00029F70D2|nr:hypothetical protein AGABI2DRAFT_194662 [Agaricus bisporus var. bisporus H97]EKV44753.1 hypothetical protein AGABI2DRAFT_194662 [Agaricus bisporus var. bisporus H97]